MATLDTVGIVFHSALALFYSVCTYVDLQFTTPGVFTFGGRWKYLTFLNLMFQLSYFLLAPLIDAVILAKGKNHQKLLTFRDTFFAVIAFPLGVFVMATFWGIYMMDRELIYPAALDKIIPPWLNHVLHTWCGVLIILEAILVKHEYPRNRVGITMMLLLGVMYIAWVIWIAHVADIWVYPFLKVMPHNAKAVFFVMCAGVLVIFYMLGKWMTKIVHIHSSEGFPDESSEVTRRPAKKKVKKVE